MMAPMSAPARPIRLLTTVAIIAAALLLLALIVPVSRWAEWFAHPVRMSRGGGIPEVTLEGARWLRVMLVVLAVTLVAGTALLVRLVPHAANTAENTIPPAARSSKLWLAALLLLAFLVRLPRLTESLWYDEISAFLDFGIHGPGAIVGNYFVQSNHVAHTLATWMSTELLGVNELSLRLPALLASIAAVWATWRLAREAAPGREALAIIAALALAVMPVSVLEGVEARGYSMMILAAAASTWLFVRAERTGSAATWLLYAAVVALGTWAHLVTVCVAIGHGAIAAGAAMWTRDRRRIAAPATALVMAAVMTVTLLAPLLPDLLRIRREFTVVEGNEPTLLGPEGLRALLQLGGAWWTFAAIPGFVLLAAGVVAASRDRRLAWCSALALAGLPVAILLAVLGGSWLYARFLLFALPGVGLLVAAGLLLLPRRLAIVAGLVTLAGWGTDLVRRPPKQPLRDAVLEVVAKRRPGDVVGAIGLVDNVIAWYGVLNDMPIHPAGPGGVELEALIARHAPRWIILYYPESVPRERYEQLERAGYVLETRHHGWVDWTNGDVMVYRRQP